MNEPSQSAKSDARLYFIHALSPLHAGTGEGVGAVNLPTARECLTGYPFLPGTSLKGVLRAAADARFPKIDGRPSKETHAAFGPDTANASDSRGGIVFSDASLLALPVRSLFGTFAWVTCPYVLRRLRRDARETSVDTAALDKLLTRIPHQAKKAWLPEGSILRGEGSGQLFLLDLSLPEEQVMIEPHVTDVAGWIGERVWPSAGRGTENAEAQQLLKERFVVIDDDLFGLLSRTATEIRSRVKIDDNTGTAASSGSWTEEHLPAESLLHGVAIGRKTRYATPGSSSGEEISEATAIGVLDQLLASDAPTLRLGGKSSTGLGRARMTIAGGGK